MKQLLLSMFMLMMTAVFAQDAAVIIKEAENLERGFKEAPALEKYKQVVAVDSDNITALVKAAELSCSIAGREADKKVKKTYVDAAKGYAEKALSIAPNNADANFAMSVVAAKLTETETENKKIIENVKNIRTYADKALAINPNHAKANFALGKWHFEMVKLSWVKKAALKAFFGGMPEATIEDAFRYMEKGRTLDQYNVANYLELAKAYKYDNKPAKAIEVLNKLVKLPTRTADDPALKSEGKKLLEEMQ